MRTLNAWSATLGVALLGSAAAFVAAAPTARAATCDADSCTGQDPVASGCDDANTWTIDTVNAGSYVVNLRYSSDCYAVWAQAVGTGSSSDRGAVEGFPDQSTAYPDTVYATGTPTSDGTYSLMISYNSYTRACQEINYSGWEDNACTPEH